MFLKIVENLYKMSIFCFLMNFEQLKIRFSNTGVKYCPALAGNFAKFPDYLEMVNVYGHN
ncbi:hypothetical protein ASU31_00185 [Pedobacter ginsenosidimutans]|uniref:Uncharacterized protein n=1 Tax=Pedobacter ginsenosidimutans TaxID=687842 RepID=A0A0T5VV63_9SPHI|nr:hypothetical protein ASU31_00185 [Pedobacter ginsenosidimutans]